LSVLLRRTEKLASALPLSADVQDAPDTAFGDCYLNCTAVHHQPLLLLLSAVTLLPYVVPAKEVRRLPAWLPHVVRLRL
jgi:hypothetical protein